MNGEKIIKDYIIKERLGLGAFGTVFKVLKKSNNKIYVIKKISYIGLTPKQINNAKLESKILSSFQSPFIVKYHESFEENNSLYIVMEYCDGGDLNQFISKNKETGILLEEEIIWNIFLKILIGLAELHKSRILHRDLKPLNIFLTKKNFDIKIGDFGIAKLLEKNRFAQTIIGTPYYLSPELCEELPYDDKSDVWALGCILYELCTYKHPFKAKCQASLVLKILQQNPKPIHENYSQNLQNLIYLILDKNHKTRPSCYDILHLSYVVEKLKVFGLYDKAEFIYSQKNSNMKQNYSIDNYFSLKAEKKKDKINYNKYILYTSKSNDNIKKLKSKLEDETKKKNDLIVKKEPTNNYKNYINKINIPNKLKNSIDEFETKMKKERTFKNNIINSPKNRKNNFSFFDVDNEDEFFNNLIIDDILNSIEVERMINNKLIKMKKEKKKINIKEFANFLNNNSSKII